MPSTDPRTRPVRPEIQALRAVAVMMVVGFHLWPGRLPGGYIGVDVFFVISGFLITAHLLREVEATGRVGLGAFWARRARRLLPAAYLVLAVSSIAVVAWMPVGRWMQNFREIIGSALYVENWVLAADSVDYLAADNLPSVVQHYWTLSVEEQFYLVWPLLVLLGIAVATRMRRSARAGITVIVAVTTIGAFAYSLWVTSTNPTVAYFATPARAWQFGAGALFALWEADRRYRVIARPAAAWVSWAGFGALLAGALIYNESTPFPGTAALLPTVATLAIFWAAMPTGPASPAPLLALRPVQATGDISYSMYLWHWPPIILLPEILGHGLGFWPRAWILVGTIAAAWLTYRLVESPVRRTRRFGLRRPAITGLATLTGASLLVIGAGWGWREGRQAEQEAAALTARFNENMPRCFGAAAMDPQHPCENPALDDVLIPSGANVARDFADYPECWTLDDETAPRVCTFGDTRDATIPHLVLIGDSHLRAMLPAFIRLTESGEISFTAMLKGGCPLTSETITNVTIPERLATCPPWQKNARQWMIDHADNVDAVVAGGYARLLGETAKKRAGGLVNAWRPIVAAGVPVVALSDNPYHETSPAICLERHETWDETTCSIPRADAFAYGDPFGDAARRLKGASSLNLTQFYCDQQWCPSVISGVNVYRDNSHLTTTYTRTLTPYLWRALNQLGVKP